MLSGLLEIKLFSIYPEKHQFELYSDELSIDFSIDSYSAEQYGMDLHELFRN